MGNAIRSSGFHTWGNRRGRFPPEMHATKFGVVAYSQENDRGSIRCIGCLAPEDRCLCPECASGRVLIEADVPSEPAALIAFIQTPCARCSQGWIESGPTSPWLGHLLKGGRPGGLHGRLPCSRCPIRAPSKSDRNDAHGLGAAEMGADGLAQRGSGQESHGMKDGATGRSPPARRYARRDRWSDLAESWKTFAASYDQAKGLQIRRIRPSSISTRTSTSRRRTAQ